MGRQPQLARVQTDDTNLNRVQDALAQALGPMLGNPLLGAADFRFTEVPGATPAALPLFALQYRTPGTTKWVTVLTVDSTGQIAQPAWIAPTMLNSWVNFGGALMAAGFVKDAQGFVHLRGVIKSGTINTAAFILPVGYRPSATVQFPSLDGANAAGLVQVDSAGNVQPQIGSNTTYRLDGITFDTRS